MKRTRWRKRCAAIVMAFAMVIGSFSGIMVYADGDEDQDHDYGFYTAADMASDHYISSSPEENPVTYTDGYTVYFVYKNQVGDYYEGDTESGDEGYDNRENISVSEVKLNYDGDGNADYTVALGDTDDSGISFVTAKTTSAYTVCKLTIPADLGIGNAYVEPTYTKESDSSDTRQEAGQWLYLKQLKTGLVQYFGESEWNEELNQFTRTEDVTQENISQNINISVCDYGNDFFGIATVDKDGNTSYADADFKKLSIQKKTDNGWVSTTDGTLEHPDGAADGYYRYFFTSAGTYSITYTNGSAESRVIVNVSEFDSGYVTDPADFAKGFIVPEENVGQVFYYQGGKSDTFYFVFKTNDNTRSIETDSSGNAILYRYNGSENVQTTLDGVTVTEYTDSSVEGYKIYKITLTDSYDFEGGFALRLLDSSDPDAEPDDRNIGIEMSNDGLNFSEPGEGDPDPVYDADSLTKSKLFTVGTKYLVYFVTKSESGVTRYTSVPAVKTLDGTAADVSAYSIEKNTDFNDNAGLYNVTFRQTGTYKIVSSDNSYVIAKVKMPEAAYYTSSDITVENLVSDTYSYSEGSGSLYLAIKKDTESTRGYTVSWSESTANDDGTTNADLLKEYGITATKVSGTEGYDVYKLNMTYGVIATDWMGLNILYTATDGNSWFDCAGISLECKPANGSLVTSWSEPKSEEDGVKIRWVNARCNYLYLATVTTSTDPSGYSYSLVTADAANITITSLDGSKAPTVEKTDVEGQYKFSFAAGITDGTYCVTVGNASTIIKKSAEVEVLYKADSKGMFTPEDEYDFSDTFDITTAKTENERTFYAYFSQERLGEENAFHYVYVGDPDANNYYYFADLLTNDSTKDWAGKTVTKNTSGKVTVVNEDYIGEGDVLLKITVSDSAVGENFIIGAAIQSNGVTGTEPWVEDKDVLVLKVTATVDKENSTQLNSTVDDGYVTITEVPAIEDLDLATNFGTDQENDTSLSEGEAASAQKVEVSIKTEEIKVDSSGKVEVASDASDAVKAAAEKQQEAVTSILEKKESLLNSKKYNATFLDLSVSATVTKKATDDDEGNTTQEGETVKVSITETKQPLTIKVPIPKDLKDMRGFSIIRYHEGANKEKLTEKLWADVVYDTDKKTPLYLEFQTDKFSTYALAYRAANATDDLNLSGAEWKVTGDKNFVYDGTEKSITLAVSGLKGCTYTLKGTTKATEIGDYTVYVDEVTYNGVTYPASEVELPAAIAKGFTWSIKSELSDEDDDDATKNPTPTPKPTVTSTPKPATDTTDKKDDTSNSTETVEETKKGDTVKKSGNTYTVTSTAKKTVAFTSVKKNAKTVTIPSKVTINGVSYKVTSIAANAFKNDKKLTKVTIPSTVTKIGASAFYGCTKLATVTISKNVTSIGKSAFYGCTSLKKITLPSNLTSIGASAFSGCTKLANVTIPSKVITIGAKAFYNCSKLSKVTFKGTKITTIGSKAFTKIAKKPTITVPSKKKTAYTKLLKKAGYTKTVKKSK